MLKNGSIKQPLDRVASLAAALDCDPRLLFNLALDQMGRATTVRAIEDRRPEHNRCRSTGRWRGRSDWRASLWPIARLAWSPATGLTLGWSRETRAPHKPSIDRRHGAQGYTPANCRVTSIFFNMARGDFPDEVFWRVAEAIVQSRACGRPPTRTRTGKPEGVRFSYHFGFRRRPRGRSWSGLSLDRSASPVP